MITLTRVQGPYKVKSGVRRVAVVAAAEVGGSSEDLCSAKSSYPESVGKKINRLIRFVSTRELKS